MTGLNVQVFEHEAKSHRPCSSRRTGISKGWSFDRWRSWKSCQFLMFSRDYYRLYSVEVNLVRNMNKLFQICWLMAASFICSSWVGDATKSLWSVRILDQVIFRLSKVHCFLGRPTRLWRTSIGAGESRLKVTVRAGWSLFLSKTMSNQGDSPYLKILQMVFSGELGANCWLALLNTLSLVSFRSTKVVTILSIFRNPFSWKSSSLEIWEVGNSSVSKP